MAGSNLETEMEMSDVKDIIASWKEKDCMSGRIVKKKNDYKKNKKENELR